MEKVTSVAKQLQKKDRILSGLLRISSILQNPENYYDKVDSVGGWVSTIRKQNNDTLLFIALSDGSCNKNLQIVVQNTIPNFSEIISQKPPACLRIKGCLIKSPAKGQDIEMVVENDQHSIEVIGPNMDFDNYPLNAKRPSLEYLRDYLHLRPKTNLIPSMARIRNALAMATHSFFQELGFIYIHTPIITASDCEGAGEMFQVTTLLSEKKNPESEVSKIPQTIDDQKQQTGKIDYDQDFFKKKASLTVSGQLAVENYACALTNVYTFGPTFRAENSNTTRHLSEFWMIEPEICFAGLDELFALIEGYVKYCIQYCYMNVKDDMEFFAETYKRNRQQKKKQGKKHVEGFEDLEKYLKDIMEAPFKRMSYTEAIDYLMKQQSQKKNLFVNKVEWGMDLASEHERYLCENYIKGPVFLYNYPREIKAFYMKFNDDQKTVQGTDLLLPFIGEVVGGSVREERIDVLKEQIKFFNLDEKDYQFYIDLRKYGTVPHAGFGLGFERLVMLVTGIENIREAIPFPRYPKRCDC